MRKKRNILIFTILFMAIGFAGVATNLIINGSVSIGANIEDFDIIFTNAVLDNVDISNTAISQDGKRIVYRTNKLGNIGDISQLRYTAKNNSKQYDANIEINCALTDNEYTKVQYSPKSMSVKAQQRESGIIEIELIKPTIDDKEIGIECTLLSSAIETTELKEYNANGKIAFAGYLIDSNEEPVADQDIVIFSDIPKYTKTDSEGYFYANNLEEGNHEIFLISNSDKTKTKDELILSNVEKGEFTTSSKEINIGSKKVTNIILDNELKTSVVTLINGEKEVRRATITKEIEFTLSNISGTNIVCNNSAMPSINNNKIVISKVSSDTKCYVNDNLLNISDELDGSLQNVVMIANDKVNESINIANNNNINLYLNGYKIEHIVDSCTNADTLFDNYGSFNIYGDDKSEIHSNCIVIINHNKLNIDNGNYYKTGETGTIVRTGGTNTVNINDGYFNSEHYVIHSNSSKSVVNIHSGDFYSTSHTILVISGTVNIYDGKYNSLSGSAARTSSGYQGIINIYGGDFWTTESDNNAISNNGSKYILIKSNETKPVRVSSCENFDDTCSNGIRAVQNNSEGNIYINGGYYYAGAGNSSIRNAGAGSTYVFNANVYSHNSIALSIVEGNLYVYNTVINGNYGIKTFNGNLYLCKNKFNISNNDLTFEQSEDNVSFVEYSTDNIFKQESKIPSIYNIGNYGSVSSVDTCSFTMPAIMK